MKNGHVLTPIAPETGDRPEVATMWKWCIRCGALVLDGQVFVPSPRQRMSVEGEPGIRARDSLCPARVDGFTFRELASSYARGDDRFVVGLIVTYSPGRDKVYSPQEAADAALRLTRDEDSDDTEWFVHDRKTGKGSYMRQRSFDDDIIRNFGPDPEEPDAENGD